MLIGFIGAGNMGGAMINGMIAGGIPPHDFMVYDVSPLAMEYMQKRGVRLADSAVALAQAVDVVVLAVKPKHCKEVLVDLRLHANVKNLLSIAVGWTQTMLEEALPNAGGIARAMPNTPTEVRAGSVVLNENHTMNNASFKKLRKAIDSCAKTFVVAEPLFDAVTAISGSGPAYVYMFIEALGDAGVRQGLPRDMAYTLAAQTLLGASAMMLDTGKHPGVLKDSVTSPGGTTIEAVYVLEKSGFRAAVMSAVDACAEKAFKMSKQ